MRLVWIIALTIGVCRGANEFRDEASHLWDQIYDGFETIHATAYKEIHPWASTFEAKVGEALDDIFEPTRRSGEVDQPNNNNDSKTSPALPSVFPLNHLFKNVFQMPHGLFPGKRNWWNGDNVCSERRMIDEAKNSSVSSSREEESEGKKGIQFLMDFSMTSCRDDTNLHECTTTVNKNGEKKTIVLTYTCCYGYRRTDESGCEQVDLAPLTETMTKVGSEEFSKLLEGAKIDLSEGNYSIFVPNNDAVEDYRREIEGINALDIDGGDIRYKVSRRRKRYAVEGASIPTLVKGHIVPGFLDSADVHDEKVITSLEEVSKIRMTVYNTYPKKTWMANCAKVVSKNNYANNGIVHVIDKVMRPITSNLYELISSDPQFSIFKELLDAVKDKDEILKKLNDEDGQFTVLIPTNGAFDKLEGRIKDKLRSGSTCAIDIIKHHVLPNVICSGVIEGKARTINSLGKYLSLNMDEDMELTVEDKPVVVKDVVGSNGVLYVMEDFIIPESSKSVDEVLEDANLDTFKKYLEKADMMEALDERDNITIFAPSNRALEALPRDFVADKKKLKDFLMYHIAEKRFLSSAKKDTALKINTFSSSGAFLLGIPTPDIATVQCARISKRDVDVCGGTIHKIEKALFPPYGSILDIMKSEDKYSKFYKLVQDSGVDLSNQQFTVLLPTNSAFDSLPEEALSKMKENRTAWAEKIVKKHVLEDSYCCASILPRNIFLDTSGKRTLGEDIVSLRKSVGGHYYVNDAEIRVCDVMATNGVVHNIDNVLIPSDMKLRRSGGDPILPLRNIIYSGLFQ
ncbi:Midline fasciclinlike [Caligus rogercresseyi]|uniref:Midline fasciclinlike n=1 Tax=Caligus rogercresseyi TaxID=217165 RepID=A0A7T8H0Z6_CALRO|nr:Midline fasciclinlike [Caligus rogercresseyi]